MRGITHQRQPFELPLVEVKVKSFVISYLAARLLNLFAGDGINLLTTADEQLSVLNELHSLDLVSGVVKRGGHTEDCRRTAYTHHFPPLAREQRLLVLVGTEAMHG